MSDVTIVSDDAGRLVREGGVVNRGGDNPTYTPAPLPLAVHVAQTERLVLVVGIHHADDCGYHPGCTCPYTGSAPALHDPACAAHLDDVRWHCRPEAKPGVWHWTVEPLDADEDHADGCDGDCYRPNYSQDGVLLTYEACRPIINEDDE